MTDGWPRRLLRRISSVRRLALLDPDEMEALLQVARSVGREHVTARRAPEIAADAIISPLASLRFTDHLVIGSKATVGPYCAIWGGLEATTRIGPGALLAPGVVVVAGNHVVDGPGWIRRLGFDEHDAEVGEGAWVGANSTIVGCCVGEGAVIAANSVVVRDIPPFAIAAGSPATVQRMRRVEAPDQ